jgi:demethylmenaquinone methyltransferase/2-methoxy-6-polyprenyl-1,4-benzoquinol methylase
MHSSIAKSKAKYVQSLFNRITVGYDMFNTIASLGQDQQWRRKAAELAAPTSVAHALDAATGTGKLALELCDRATMVTAFDFTRSMLDKAQRNLKRRRHCLSSVNLLVGDAMNMPFQSNTFDCATVGFGIRNVDDPEYCLGEFFRVLKPGGRCVILEISRPPSGIQRAVYEIFFKQLIPLLGLALTGSLKSYRYLPRSVDEFQSPGRFALLMTSIGFKHVTYKTMHWQTTTLHFGFKPANKDLVETS